MATVDELEQRLRALEERLNSYHERLEGSLAHDRKFQLEATWGILKGAVASAVLFGTIYFAGKWFPENSVLRFGGGLVLVIPALLAAGFFVGHLERKQTEDEGKLSRLPTWNERH